MSLINGEELNRQLEIKYQTYLQEASRVETQKAEWMRGVMWGIRLAQRDLLFYINRNK